jgi:2-polyprenyl-3-methyl-5-hydroxy-6-metoxy-1,4-benzoquinol methylase
VKGIEPSTIMVRYAQDVLGLPVTVGRLCDDVVASFEPASFDAVTIWEVLEHLPDPSNGLKQVRKLLKPGGFIFIQVPNIESPVFKLFHGRWHNFSIHNHVTFFSSNVLKALLERLGYDVKDIFTYSHIYRQVGRWGFRGIPLDSDSRFVRATTMVFNHYLLKVTDSGDQIVAIARKLT